MYLMYTICKPVKSIEAVTAIHFNLILLSPLSSGIKIITKTLFKIKNQSIQYTHICTIKSFNKENNEYIS